MENRKKGRKVALLAGLALVVLSVAMVWTYREEIQSWYALWRDFEAVGRNEQRYAEYRHRETGIVFVRIPGGTFSMGTPKEETKRLIAAFGEALRETLEDEDPREVTGGPFLIAKYEVTQAEWQAVMGENPSRFKHDDLPVENVTWNDCKRFCEKTGLALPSETQWEWACRAGTTGDYGGTGNLDEMGWYKKNSGDKSHPVGEKKPNDFGLNDMHGNVREWCEDFDSPGSRFRVLRGGCWDNVAQYCRSAYRYRLAPSIRHFHIGFRPAWSSP